ncbi:aldo/keto reductase [Roseospira marina]|uniref:Aldo/keto reductase n=1 Tax=Roseospira marina TaxID=140057 RepID=A0A5M6I9Z7_9PROT|nr:aldo/keto reductase [Roseospira marina]KAA5605013.1 aldo/keto reductase [Roseospira marina]MBB4314976.1 aryl-alcohol dehydrogenase-like predicted oxidoreductase [Roseospira marina]MBB5087976.1 aryl-alcohol dehydrogenase-like predicted oxidoreductase [Roseospira marina]
MSPNVGRALGRTGWTISPLGLGCASYWAKPRFSETRARAVLTAALEAGITVLDTGASYAHGHAERRLGRLLREVGADPHSLLIGTKAGTVPDARGRLVKDFRPATVVAQVRASQTALGLERLPLLQLHGPAPEDLTDELLRALEDLRTQGDVALLGINGFVDITRHATGMAPFDVLMPFLSVMEPDNRALVAGAAATGQGVMVAGPLARMAFAPPLGRWLTRPSGLWYLARALRHGPGPLLRARALRPALTAPDWTPAQLALAWVLEQPGVACAVFGTTTPAHVTELAAAARRPLPETVRDAIARVHGDR